MTRAFDWVYRIGLGAIVCGIATGLYGAAVQIYAQRQIVDGTLEFRLIELVMSVSCRCSSSVVYSCGCACSG